MRVDKDVLRGSITAQSILDDRGARKPNNCHLLLPICDLASTEQKHLDQSCFTPIFPTRRNPNAPVRDTRIINASKAQKTALYPSIRAFEDDLLTSSEAAVIDSEMTEVIVNPTDVPSCAQVLNTAPPRACVRVGNTAEMMSRPTVKRMLVHKSWKTCVEVC